jgi:hypothetical protein
MTDAENHSDRDLSLLDAEQFMALIESEYSQQGRPLDELAKQKAWNRLQSRISEPTATGNPEQDIAKKVSARVSSVLSLAAAAVMVLALVPMFSSYPVSTMERSKGTDDFPLVNISAFALQSDGEIRSFKGAQAPGTTIVFKVDLPRPYALALAMTKGNGRPEVRYRTTAVEPGMGQLLEADGKIYGYRLESADQRLTFCAIAAEDERKLGQRIRLLTRIWDSLPKASCVLLDTL